MQHSDVDKAAVPPVRLDVDPKVGLNLFKMNQLKESEQSTATDRAYTRRVLITVAIVAAVIILLLLLWTIADTLLVIFGGILLAIFLRSLSDRVTNYTRLSNGWSLALVGLGLIGLIGVGSWLLTPDVFNQFDRLLEELPRAFDQIEGYVAEAEVGRQLLDAMPDGNQFLPDGSNLVSRAAGVLSTTMGQITNVVIIIITGIYLAVAPDLYRKGLLRLIPQAKRPRVSQVITNVVHTLQRWLVGRLISMVIIGLLTTVSLWLLGMPVALSLGLFAGIVTFVPYIGPIIAVVPAILLALLQGPTMVLYVLLLYGGIQFVESYFLTPLVQQEAVSVPPVLTISGQVMLGVLFGTLGLVFATPLMAAIMVLVKRFYVEDTLQDSLDERVVSVREEAEDESKAKAGSKRPSTADHPA